MNAEIEALYGEVAQAAYEIAEDLNGKLVIYAEIEDGSLAFVPMRISST